MSSAGSLISGAHVTNVIHTTNSGIYCIVPDSSVTLPAPLVATPNFFGDTTSAGDDIQAVVEFDANGCSPGQIAVRTFEMNAGDLAITDQAFIFVVP